MCGSAMGMVFCPADFAANGGAGFSLVFKDWVVRDARSYALACAGVFAMGAARQLLAGARAALAGAAAAPRAPGRARAPGALQEAFVDGGGGGGGSAQQRAPLLCAAADSALFALGLAFAYVNMLVAMAYDAGLLAALVAGEGVAHFGVRAAALARARAAPLSAPPVSEGPNCCAD